MTVSRDSGYISSAMRLVSESDCGWQVRAEPGQRVELTLAAFGGDVASSGRPAESDAEVRRVVDGGRSGTCHEVGSVWDDGRHPRRPLVICGPGRADRHPTRNILLFMSELNHVIIRLKSVSSLQHVSPFVIKYKGFNDHTRRQVTLIHHNGL